VSEFRVYFVQRGNDGPIKIGVTGGQIWGRLRNLQSKNAEPLRLLGFVPAHLWGEKLLHGRFAAARVEGEWFAPVTELLQFIATHALHFEPRPEGRRGRPAPDWRERLPTERD
jgi:hypothetical protein